MYMQGQSSPTGPWSLTIRGEQQGDELQAVSVYPNRFHVQFEDIYLLASDTVYLTANQLLVGGSDGSLETGRTGTMEFSDGTYARFQNGILVAGRSMEGTF